MILSGGTKQVMLGYTIKKLQETDSGDKSFYTTDIVGITFAKDPYTSSFLYMESDEVSVSYGYDEYGRMISVGDYKFEYDEPEADGSSTGRCSETDYTVKYNQNGSREYGNEVALLQAALFFMAVVKCPKCEKVNL